MSIATRTLLSAVAIAAIACGDDASPAWLTRISDEAPGAHCATGGAAVDSGPDDDGDGVLDDAEVATTEYRCDGEPPAVLTRREPEPAGAACSAGGVAVHVGRDGDGDGALADTEVEHTSYVCDVDEVWEGNLHVTTGVDGANIESVRHVRVVTGALTISGEGRAELPALEIVNGDLRFEGRVDDVSLGALVTVGGSLVVGSNVTQCALPALALVGGSLGLGPYAVIPSFEAPALRTIGGDLTSIVNRRVTAVRLPALESIGGDMHFYSADALTTLSMRALTRIGGSLTLEHNDALVAVAELPSLQTITGDIEVRINDDLERFALPALREVGARVAISGDALTTVVLSAVEEANDVSINGELLASVDLHALAYAGSVHIRGNVGALGAWQPGTLSALDLSFLLQADQLSLRGFDALTTLHLPRLQYVTDQLFLEGLGDIQEIRIPELREVTDVWIEHGADLRRIELSTSGNVRGVRFLTLAHVGPLDGELSVLPRQVGSAWLFQSTAATLDVFGALEQVGFLRIENNSLLHSLAGLHPSVAIGDLEISGHDRLSSLEGLDSIDHIGGSLTIAHNRALSNLRGLADVTVVGGDLSIIHNGQLGGLHGLAVQAVGGTLHIAANDQLTSLSGLGALTHVGGDITIDDNRLLPAAEIEQLRSRLGR